MNLFASLHHQLTNKKQTKMKKLTNAQKELIRPSAFMLDVDFVPNERKDYEDLPEPYRTELLRLYDQRTPGWFNDESKNRLNSFK